MAFSIRAQLKKTDLDGTGFISKKEFAAVLQALGAQFSDDEVIKIFDAFDKSGNDVINYHEFVDFLFSMNQSPEEMKVKIREGSECVVVSACGIFASPASWKCIRNAQPGQVLVSAGSVVHVGGYDMVPVRPKGAIDLRNILIRRPGVQETAREAKPVKEIPVGDTNFGLWEDCEGAAFEEPPSTEFGQVQSDPLPEGFTDSESAFVDPAFPATKDSIGEVLGDTATNEESAATMTDGWARLPKLVWTQASLFKHIRPSDVVQGYLGNCYFLAACATVAAHPHAVKHLFSSEDLSKHGKYGVRLYHPGQKKFVWIQLDDQVPTAEGYPAYGQCSADDEIWPALLEKAFAKLCGTYVAVEAGYPAWGMQYLCGGECEMWMKNISDEGKTWEGLGYSLPPRQGEKTWTRHICDWQGGTTKLDRLEGEHFKMSDRGFSDHEVWAALLSYKSKQYPMCCGVLERLPNMKGLIPGHAYSILDVRQIHLQEELSGRKSLRLLQVRNPYGHNEWRGAFGDQDIRWETHPDADRIKKELGFQKQENGKFYISFTEFSKYFDCFSVARISM